ncbi:MAG: OmpA family protein [Planctomycetota bacterium]|nr:OmpA family protein [Planctomycetota bacterium]
MAEHEEKHGEGEHGSHGGGKKHGGGGHGGGGSHEEHEGAPEWLISFADNVTLMMGFFVIMLAMNMGPKGSDVKPVQGEGKGGEQSADMVDLSIAIREAFNNPVSITSRKPEDAIMVKRMIQRASGSSTDAAVRGKDHDVQSVRPSDLHFPGGMVWFDDESRTLSPASREQLLNFAAQIKGLRLIIELRGHVSAAEGFRLADKAWTLSFERALAVERVLSEGGMDRRQVRIIACGDNEHAKEQAYNPTDHRQNQRVEVVVTDDLLNDPIQKPGEGKSDEHASGEHVPAERSHE